MGLNPLSLTWAWVHSAWHGPTPTRLNMVPGWLGSIWAQTDTTWARIDLARSGFGMTQLPGLGHSTWTRANYTRPEPELTRLDISLGRLESTYAQANLGLGRLSSTWTRADSTYYQTNLARHGPEPTQQDMDSTRDGLRPTRVVHGQANSDRFGLGMTGLNMSPGQLGTTWT